MAPLCASSMSTDELSKKICPLISWGSSLGFFMELWWTFAPPCLPWLRSLHHLVAPMSHSGLRSCRKSMMRPDLSSPILSRPLSSFLLSCVCVCVGVSVQVPLQEEGFHQVFQEVGRWDGQEGNREGPKRHEEILHRHPRHCSHPGMEFHRSKSKYTSNSIWGLWSHRLVNNYFFLNVRQFQ